jgi:hypothetical protein
VEDVTKSEELHPDDDLQRAYNRCKEFYVTGSPPGRELPPLLKKMAGPDPWDVLERAADDVINCFVGTNAAVVQDWLRQRATEYRTGLR